MTTRAQAKKRLEEESLPRRRRLQWHDADEEEEELQFRPPSPAAQQQGFCHCSVHSGDSKIQKSVIDLTSSSEDSEEESIAHWSQNKGRRKELAVVSPARGRFTVVSSDEDDLEDPSDRRGKVRRRSARLLQAQENGDWPAQECSARPTRRQRASVANCEDASGNANCVANETRSGKTAGALREEEEANKANTTETEEKEPQNGAVAEEDATQAGCFTSFSTPNEARSSKTTRAKKKSSVQASSKLVAASAASQGFSASPTDAQAGKKAKDTLRVFNSYYLRFVQEENIRCSKEDSEATMNHMNLEGPLKKKGGKMPCKVEDTQSNEENDKKKSRRPDLKAIYQMKRDGKFLHTEKFIGSCPGVNVGDQFLSRCEMVVIGLHSHWLGGIDYLGKEYRTTMPGKAFPLACSIVLSGNYEDDFDQSEDVVYTGSGGNDLLGNKRQIADQKLERGNLALKNNMLQDVPVRLIRGHKTTRSYTGKVYTYDGLYKVNRYWAEKGISGFTVYKFSLRRVEGQPVLTTNQVYFVSSSVPKSIGELRGLVCSDISNGKESMCIPVSNVIDNPAIAPKPFKYLVQTELYRGVQNPHPINGGCDCRGVCVDARKCTCAILNGKSFPYVIINRKGRMIEPVDVVYECGPLCGCGPDCSNRVTQHGMRYQLEVFRTPNKGWGVRSWDSIPAGAPVCEYTGLLMRSEDADIIDKNEYIFELDCLQTKSGIGGRQRRSRGSENVGITNVPDENEFCINAGSSGNVSRFINHSCEPNLFVQCVLNEHHDLSQTRIWFVAAENIPPLQELSYDYNFEIGSVVEDGKVKVLHCYCGAQSCQKRLH